jgi:hypothetical protein
MNNPSIIFKGAIYQMFRYDYNIFKNDSEVMEYVGKFEFLNAFSN